MKTRHLLIPLIAVSIVCLGASCDDSTQSYYSSGSSSGYGSSGSDYNGPGSAWTVELNSDGSFYIEVRPEYDQPVETWILGTYERFATGFIEFIVSAAYGVDPPNVDDQAAGIEAPGFGLWMRPFGEADGELIPMVISGECPTADVAGNWLMMTCNSAGVSCDATSNTREFFGSFTYDFGTGQAMLPSRFTLGSGTDLGSSDLGTASCSDGVMLLSDAVIYLTETEGAIVQVNPDDLDDAQHIVAIPEEVLVQADLEGSYFGLGFDKDEESSFAVRTAIDAGGTTGTIYILDQTELETGAPGTAVGTIAFTAVNQVGSTAADGWITGSFTWLSNPSRPLYCMSASNLAGSSGSLMLCVGQGPADTEKFFNFVMRGL